mmetsp:Transcript_26913/g.58733  ORF Transcript_26913/g.58733 Transcript_26913/m.58733 type:complete len:808 (-) Transcript_26913:411-2834(-)
MSGNAKAAPGKDVEAQKSAPNYGGVAPMPAPPLVVRKPKDSTLIVWVLGFLLFLGLGAAITMLIVGIDSDDDDSDDKTHELRGEIDEFDSDSDDFQPPPPSELVGIAASAASGINSVWEPYITLLLRVDFEAVRKDIRLLLTDSQDFWPADFGTYGPFFIHLAWHCAATYRVTDGRGGCEGGRPRFEPERSFLENVNKDRAWLLLKPIKDKYGRGLSWGDLIILTANIAIHDLGGPVLGFCAGRIDVKSGYRDHVMTDRGLIPIVDQPGILPQHDPQVLGPICTNAEGANSTANPANTTEDIRITFALKGFNDEETVALVGGGHTFGKTHGACVDGGGDPPNINPANPWKGKCGTGIREDVYASGFEGPWTTHPIRWDNEYFQNLINFEWVAEEGQGGLTQWGVDSNVNNAIGPRAIKPFADLPPSINDTQPTMMLTTDIAFISDPSFKLLVEKFAHDMHAFNETFSNAWYKLTTQDMGYNRCLPTTNLNLFLPPPQEFQHPLPPVPEDPPTLFDTQAVINKTLYGLDDQIGWKPLLVTFAYNCAQTWRVTDHSGGCNGARIRFNPGKSWRANAGVVDEGMTLLSPIKVQFGESLTWADLIVQTGTLIINNADPDQSNPLIPFCPGRADDTDGDDWEHLEPLVDGDFEDDLVGLKDYWLRSGLSFREMVALQGRMRSPDQQRAMGYAGSWANDTFANSGTHSNEYFRVLTTEEWEVFELNGVFDTQLQFKAKGKQIFMKKSDLLLLEDGTEVAQDSITNDSESLRSIVADFAFDNSLFLETFALAWKKLMNADRLNGPTSNVCADVA